MIIASIICAVICGFAYQIWFCKQPPSRMKSGVKTMAIAALALAALLTGASGLLVAGLAFCALGDFWLSRDGERAFLIGLISFAIGHICYIGLFFNAAAAPLFLLEMPWVIAVGALMMTGGFMGRVLWPVTGALRIPVMVYIAIIITMGAAAISTTQNGSNIVLIGAGLFILSDIILSAELFLLPQKHKLRRVTPQFVWTFYWFGQVVIFSGIVFF
jgi:uncharacterized membrane protein YhhN